MFIRFYRIHERDGRTDEQTDEQTPHEDIGRACIASRGTKMIESIVEVNH